MSVKLLFIRHGLAENQEAFAKTKKPDTLRPLTARGRKKMRKNALGLSYVVPSIDVLMTSPLVRALETAKIVRKFYPKARGVQLEELAPHAAREDLLKKLGQFKNNKVIALVGHEPHLSKIIDFFLTGGHKGFLDFKKGGACLLEFRNKLDKGGGHLVFLIQPGELRKIASRGEE